MLATVLLLLGAAGSTLLEAAEPYLVQRAGRVERAKTPGQTDGLLDELRSLADEQSRAGDTPSALRTYEELRRQSRSVGSATGEIEALRGLGRLHRGGGHSGQAITVLSSALALAADSADARSSATLLHDIGMVYSGVGDPLSASEFFERALIKMDEGGMGGRYRVLNNLGVVLTQLGDLDQARASYELAFELAAEAIGESGDTSAIVNAGVASVALENFEVAIQYLEAAMEDFRRHDDKPSISATLVILGVAHECAGRIGDAEHAFDEARRVALGGGVPGVRVNALVSLATTHASMDRFESASQLMRDAVREDRRRMQGEHQQVLAEFRAEFKSREQQLEIDALEQAAEVAGLRLDHLIQQRKWLGGLSFGSLLGVFCLASISQSRRRALTGLRSASAELGMQRDRLHATLDEVSALRGLLSICSGCASIHDPDGKWVRLEAYVGERTGAEFSHGICNTCLYENLGPDLQVTSTQSR